MLQVHHLSLQSVLHHIHQGQLISQVLQEERRGGATGGGSAEEKRMVKGTNPMSVGIGFHCN